MTWEKELATLEALYEVHKTDKTVLCSNGFLDRIRDNDELINKLPPELRDFVDLSIEIFENDALLAIEAISEGNNALIVLEQRAKELEEAHKIAEEAKAEAEGYAVEIARDRDAIKTELENAQQYQMQSDRQRMQFVTAQAHAYPAWGLLYVFLFGIMALLFWNKDGVDVLVPVFAGILGALYQAYSGAFSGLFAPIMKEEKKPEKKESEQLGMIRGMIDKLIKNQ